MDDNAELATPLDRLVASDIEFILVGGLAAVVQGAPVTTFDVDIVHRRTETNVRAHRAGAFAHEDRRAQASLVRSQGQTALPVLEATLQRKG